MTTYMCTNRLQREYPSGGPGYPAFEKLLGTRSLSLGDHAINYGPM